MKATGFAFLFFVCLVGYAQNAINYKALIKDNNGNVVVNQNVDIQFNILEGAGMTLVYTERHALLTDDYGIVITDIGEGSVQFGSYEAINWGNDNHHLNVQVDIDGNGLVDMGTTEFKAVPYALMSDEARNVKGLEAIDEGNGLGWRLIGRNPDNYGDIGNEATDLSLSGVPSTEFGATGFGSFATGISTKASGARSTAMGLNTEASGDTSTALGNTNVASGDNSFAVGLGTQASGIYSSAFGFNTHAGNPYAFAAGDGAEALGEVSFAFGEDVLAGANHAVAFGFGTLSGGYAFTAGFESQAGALYSAAIGYQSEADGVGSFAAGYSPWASGDYAVALGQASASGENAIAMGRNTSASGLISTAMGSLTFASGDYATSTGKDTEAIGYASFSANNFTDATGSSSFAMGSFTVAGAAGSLATGNGTLASGNYSSSFGSGTRAQSYSSMAIGTYNLGGGNFQAWVSTDPVFEIGNGTSDMDRSNALIVLKNGHVGLGTNSPNNRLQITNGSDVSSGNALGYLVLGNGNSTNIAIDNNEIMARNNNDIAPLYLQNEGNNEATLSNGTGLVVVGNEGSANLILDQNEIQARNNGSNAQLHLNPHGNLVVLNSAIIVTSDRRLKKDINTIDYGLKEILDLNPVSYYWKDKPNPYGKSIGLIAQDLQKIVEEAVYEIDKEDEQLLHVNYSALIPVLIKAIQEQQMIITDQEKTINKQAAILNEVVSRLDVLERKNR